MTDETVARHIWIVALADDGLSGTSGLKKIAHQRSHPAARRYHAARRHSVGLGSKVFRWLSNKNAGSSCHACVLRTASYLCCLQEGWRARCFAAGCESSSAQQSSPGSPAQKPSTVSRSGQAFWDAVNAYKLTYQNFLNTEENKSGRSLGLRTHRIELACATCNQCRG